MAKRLSKTDLLTEIYAEREKLDDLLDSLRPRQMTKAGVTGAGWSVKDILGHVISWQQLNLGWYESGMRGESPAVPAEGFGWGDIRLLNEKIFRQHRRRSLKAVVGDYELYHGKMLKLVETVRPKQLVAIGHFDWTGPSWSLSDYIRANTASHYRWAAKHLRKWKKTL